MGKKRVLVTGNQSREEVRAAMERVRDTASRHAETLESDLECPRPVPDGRIDLAVVVGGDGSILKASRCLAQAGIPCMGVNMGRLGFLAGFQVEELEAVLPSIIESGGERVERIMFRVNIDKRDGHHPEMAALNDVVVGHGANHRMIGVTVDIGHEPVATYYGDGVIVATPTGSTAYNLASGGPIVEGRLGAVVITPISPHMLTNRSIVIDADAPITLRPMGQQQESTCVIDGQVVVNLVEGDVVHVSKSPHRFVLVENNRRSSFETLREKLHWNHPPRYGTARP